MNLPEMFNQATPGNTRGRMAELLVATKLTSEGYNVMFSPCDSPHDLVVDKDGKTTRLQVKLGYAKQFKTVVNLSSNTSRGRKHYIESQFDYFAIVEVDPIDVSIYFMPNYGEGVSQKVITDELRSCTTLP